MGTASIPSKECHPQYRPPRKKHVYVVDKEDKRFKVCGFCGDVKYRTDKEVMGNDESQAT